MAGLEEVQAPGKGHHRWKVHKVILLHHLLACGQCPARAVCGWSQPLTQHRDSEWYQWYYIGIQRLIWKNQLCLSLYKYELETIQNFVCFWGFCLLSLELENWLLRISGSGVFIFCSGVLVTLKLHKPNKINKANGVTYVNGSIR